MPGQGTEQVPGQGQEPVAGRGTVPELGQVLDAGQELGEQAQVKDPDPDWGQEQDAALEQDLTRETDAALEPVLGAGQAEELGPENVDAPA